MSNLVYIFFAQFLTFLFDLIRASLGI